MQSVLGNYGVAFLALLAFALLAAPAQGDERQREFVPELNAYGDLSDRIRVFLRTNLTENMTSNSDEEMFGAHLDFTLKPIVRTELQDANWEHNRYLWTRIGYQQLDTPDQIRIGPTERRGVVELTARMPMPQKVWLEHRAKVDLRDIGGAFSQRYRYRLHIDQKVKMGSVVTVPYAQAEFFYDTRYDSWNRQLYQAGATIELSKHWRVEPYLALQYDNRSISGNVDRVGLKLKYYH